MDDSVNLYQRFCDGDDSAASELYERYINRLVGLARSRISSKLRRRVDAEDVAQSVFRSFFVNARDEKYAFERNGDLWRLLSSLTINKVLRHVQKQTRQKRSIDMEQSVFRPDGGSSVPVEMIMEGPTPDDALALVEELESFMSGLNDTGRQVLELRLQGLPTERIAAEISRSERTVRRILEGLKDNLQEMLLGDGGSHSGSSV